MVYLMVVARRGHDGRHGHGRLGLLRRGGLADAPAPAAVALAAALGAGVGRGGVAALHHDDALEIVMGLDVTTGRFFSAILRYIG